MIHQMITTLMVFAMIATGIPAHAGRTGGPAIPDHNCDKAMVRQYYEDANQEAMDAVQRHFGDSDKQGWSDSKFCQWLADGMQEASTCPGNCPTEEYADEDLRAVPQAVRRSTVVERVERVEPQSAGGGFDWTSALIGGGVGLLAGWFANDFFDDRKEQNQRQYFPPPQGGYWGRPPQYSQGPGGGWSGQYPPRILPIGNNGAPPIAPWPGGNQYAGGGPFVGGGYQTGPWVAPYQGGQQTGYTVAPNLGTPTCGPGAGGYAPAICPPAPFSLLNN